MSKKLIRVRDRLISISFDLDRMLKEGIKTKDIYDSLVKRLERVKESKWQKLEWS